MFDTGLAQDWFVDANDWYSTRCSKVPIVNFEFLFSSHLGTQQVFELFRFLALE